MLGTAGVAGAYVYKAYQTLPAFEEFDPSLTSVILDNKGQVVYKLVDEENRTLISDLSQVPKEVQQAFIATEDRRFYDHFGIDVFRLGGAVWSDLKYFLGAKDAQLEGASTITMQLARNAFLTLDQTVNRKVQEMLIAVKLEQMYTKDEILRMYLNEVSFGYRASGLEAAAQTYFSKSAKDLTVSEGAMLAGILKAPSAYNPIDNYEGAMSRRAIVLDLMVKQNYLEPEQAEELKQEQVVVNPAKVSHSSVTFTGDWYADYVMQILTSTDLSAKYGTPVFDDKDLFNKGLKIYTALDTDYQQVAEQKIKQMMPVATREYGASQVPQAASVIMDHTTGEVKALVGGLEHNQMRAFNRATGAKRQPGSSIKPLAAYLPAIDVLGWGPATVIDDSPPMLNEKKTNVWPENYEFRYSGLQPMRWGLEQSINAMAVRALQAVTPAKGLEYAKKLGLDSLDSSDENLSLALGGLTEGVTPLEMTTAFGTLGNLGMRVDPVVITKIEDKSGKVLFEATPKKQQVVRKESVWLMVDIMKGSLSRGTAAYESKAVRGWPVAGKTGTTEDWHDAWFVGFTPQIVTAVWTGYDNDEGRKPLPAAGGRHWTGAGPPTRIWTAIMSEIIKQRPADWERPSGLTQVTVCKTSGLLPGGSCPADKLSTDWFRVGYGPKQVDNVWTPVKVVKQPWTIPGTTNTIERYLLWQEGCAGTPEDRLMIKRPTTYARHPSNPFNFARYWPKDWVDEVPVDQCVPAAVPPGTGDPTKPPGDGDPTKPPGDGDTKPPGDGDTKPPGDGDTKPPDDGDTQPPADGGGVTDPPTDPAT